MIEVKLIAPYLSCRSLAPAAARTAIFDQMQAEHMAYRLGKIPMGRPVETTEIAAMIAGLASEDGSFSSGAVFDLSGGQWVAVSSWR